MEHNINIGGQVVISCPDLVQAATLFLAAFSKGVHAEVTKVETPVYTDTNVISDAVAVGMPVTHAMPEPKHLNYGVRCDGATYTQWNDMCKALDTISESDRVQLIKTYSEDGTYGGVPASAWGKVIEACKQGQAQPSVTPVVPQASVQTVTHTYKLDDLAAAASTLMDAGRQNDLIALLQQFGVDSLPALQADQFGAFATALRGMGAKI